MQNKRLCEKARGSEFRLVKKITSAAKAGSRVSRHAKLRPSTLISKPYTSGGNDYMRIMSFAVTVLFCSLFVRELSLSLVSRSVHQSLAHMPTQSLNHSNFIFDRKNSSLLHSGRKNYKTENGELYTETKKKSTNQITYKAGMSYICRHFLPYIFYICRHFL